MNKETNDLLEPSVNAHGVGARRDWQKRWPANCNVAPTNDIPVAATHDGTRTIESVRWRMVAPYAKEFGGKPTFNARIETVATNGMFKRPFLERRVVVPSDAVADELEVFEVSRSVSRVQKSEGVPNDGPEFIDPEFIDPI